MQNSQKTIEYWYFHIYTYEMLETSFYNVRIFKLECDMLRSIQYLALFTMILINTIEIHIQCSAFVEC